LDATVEEVIIIFHFTVVTFFLFTPKAIDISGWSLHSVRTKKREEWVNQIASLHCHIAINHE
jgi:hypothetical protein